MASCPLRAKGPGGNPLPAEVLILGGGFAGLAAAHELSRRNGPGRMRVRLVDRRNLSVFAPLLPDLISNRVKEEQITFSIRRLCERLGVEFVTANVKSIHPSEPRVLTQDGELACDYLVVCTGCDTDYFGNASLKTRVIGLKWTEEGTTIRRRALRMLAEGSGPPDFLIVGGGYTGFEAASHLARLVHCRTKTPFRCLHRAARITVLEKSDTPLANVPPGIRSWALGLIRGYGVEVRTGVTFERFDGDDALLTDATAVSSPLVLWTAGVAPGPAVAKSGLPTSNGGRLEVDEYLRLRGAPAAFAAGDVAAVRTRGSSQALRMAVQFSLSGGRHAAANVARAVEGKALRPYRPLDPGYVVPLAPGAAAGKVLGLSIAGRIPYLLHYFMCVYRTWGWKKKWRVLSDLFGKECVP